jgi:hypothetical protein
MQSGHAGLVAPGCLRPDPWSERVLTLEAPGSHSIEVRVQAHLVAIEAAIEYCSRLNRE